MGQAVSIRFERGITAAVVLLAHALLVWIIIEARLQIAERETTAEPVIASLIDQPRRVPLGAVPIEVRVQGVQRLQNFKPDVPDFPQDKPEPAPNVVTVPQPVSVPEAPARAQADESGIRSASSGPPAAGRSLTLVERVVPRYPSISARRGEQGNAVMQLLVNEAGRVVEAKVAGSSGSSRLDKAALEAVRKWRFAPLPRGSAPQGTWGQTEVRFVLYRFTYSRLGAHAAVGVYGEQVKAGALDEATPGSEAALRRFIADVASGAISSDPDPVTRDEVTRLRAALGEWGAVKSMQFTGGLAERAWVAYDIKPEFRAGFPHASVEVRWDMYEVRHQHATSEWLVAVDRNGMIWSAQAGPAPR